MPSATPPPPKYSSVLSVTGAPQLPLGGRTAACRMYAHAAGQPTVLPQSATACPSGPSAMTGCCPPCGWSPPGPRSVACQVFPSGLVHTCTCVVPSAALKVPPAAMAPALFTAQAVATVLPGGSALREVSAGYAARYPAYVPAAWPVHPRW
jgi:hypothetical protein